MMKFGGLLLALMLALAACSGSDGVAADSEEALLAYLEEGRLAFVNVDFEAMHRLQGPGCDYTLAEVREGFQTGQALAMAFTGGTIDELAGETKFEITAFDDTTKQATVIAHYTGDDPAFQETEDDETEYRFSEGQWVSDEACIGAAADFAADDPAVLDSPLVDPEELITPDDPPLVPDEPAVPDEPETPPADSLSADATTPDEPTLGGLMATLENSVRAYIDADVEYFFETQADDCGHTLEEVAAGYAEIESFFFSFFGVPFSEYIASTEFEILAFDEDALTATVIANYVGDDPSLSDDENEPTEFFFAAGRWTDESDCIGAGVG